MKLPIDYDKATREERMAAWGHAVLELIVALRMGTVTAGAKLPSGKVIVIPTRFWRQLSDREIASFMQKPELDPGMCIRLWECLKRRGNVPEIRLVIDRTQAMQVWPAVEKMP